MSTDLFDTYARSFEARRETVMTLGEYLKGCKTDPLMYACLLYTSDAADE